MWAPDVVLRVSRNAVIRTLSAGFGIRSLSQENIPVIKPVLAQALYRLMMALESTSLDSSKSAHERVTLFITFTTVVDVSIAQQQAVVQ